MYSYSELAHAHDEVLTSGSIKSSNEDFRVDEIMPIKPSGNGEHLWLLIQKSGCNTEWLARQLAEIAAIKPMAVSYAGLKDRHAVTTQWFSMHLPGCDDPDLSTLESDEISVIKAVRHNRKLKRGVLAGNRFTILIKDLSAKPELLEARLKTIQATGVPNYFGEQRFGHQMNNLSKAEQMFSGARRKMKKHQRGIYLSAARSWVFNQVCSQRVKEKSWNTAIAGDVFSLDGKTACFMDDGSDDINQRITSAAIHPTGAMWGQGESMAKDVCLALEREVASRYSVFTEGLERAGLRQERRPLRLMVKHLNWAFINHSTLSISFELPAGAYATTVLRELADISSQTFD